MNKQAGTQQLSPLQSSHSLPQPSTKRPNGSANKLSLEDRHFHNWYRFVLSFPPHLVRSYIGDFGLQQGSVLLDPFCGCGTTLIEGKLLRLKTVGVEANPFAEFASKIKVDWNIDPDSLLEDATAISQNALRTLKRHGLSDEEPQGKPPSGLTLRTLSPEQTKLLLSDSISPIPLHKSLVLLDCIQRNADERLLNHQLLAFANAIVFNVSNLHFGPEVGLGQIKKDVPVVSAWLKAVEQMVEDLRGVKSNKYPASKTLLADARNLSDCLSENSVDAVITSPPYPNEKDYTRTTRLESVLLGFIQNKAGLRSLKGTLIRSNTRNVYKGDDDDKWIAEHKEIHRIAQAIETRRIELNKDSGFEKLYGRVTKLYFGGMARHLADLRTILKPGAKLAYVVGDQASYLRIMIRTGQLLADIGQALGYEVLRIDLFRTRFASATKEQLREEVVVLRWPERKA